MSCSPSSDFSSKSFNSLGTSPTLPTALSKESLSQTNLKQQLEAGSGECLLHLGGVGKRERGREND